MRTDVFKIIKWMFHIIASLVGAYIFLSLIMALFSAGGRYALFGLLLLAGLLFVIVRAFVKFRRLREKRSNRSQSGRNRKTETIMSKEKGRCENEVMR